ncbi:MAG TPA: IclR family transcriptional regulator [Stellaceae bacterium]|nr:IclR family transcriptional regulator [Stellaceae bacterium]
MSEQAQAAVKSADRVLDLFELLAHAGREMSHSNISEVLQIPKSSLTQLLKNLLARGYIETTPNGRGYRLGDTLLSLSESAGQIRNLASHAEAFLSDVTRETGESSALNQLKGEQTEVVASVLGPARLVTHMRLGDLAPLYATSGGKAILAHMPMVFQENYFSCVRFEATTPTTLKSVKALRQQLAAVRKSGFAFSHQEWTPGIVGIAVPLLDITGAPLGSINVAIPSARFDATKESHVKKMLRRSCDGLRHLVLGRRQGVAATG